MAQYFRIHPQDPQPRLINQTIDIIQKDGAVIAYPTDSAYALGCKIGDIEALERIRSIRKLDKSHNFTLVCHDLSELSTYAQVDNPSFRLLKANTPGAYTFILEATREVPHRLMHPKRKTIGLRIPDNNIAIAILAGLGSPLLSVTLILPGSELPLADPEEINNVLGSQVDLVIDGGFCGLDPTTVVDLTDGVRVVRTGKGSITPFI